MLFYRLLYHNVINVHRELFRKVYREVKYPTHGYPSANITYIKVIDLKTDGTGGYPYLFSGGIGYRNVTIRLASQSSHGLHFNVSIFGR